MFDDVVALVLAGLPLQIFVTLSASAIYALLPESELGDERQSLKATASVVLSLSLILLVGVGLSLIHFWSMWSLLFSISIVLSLVAKKIGRFESRINRTQLLCLFKLLPFACFLLGVGAIIVFYEEYSIDDQMYGFLGEILSRQGDLYQPFSIRRIQGLPGKSFLDAFSFHPRLNTQISDVSISGILLTAFGWDMVQRQRGAFLILFTTSLPFSILYLTLRIVDVEETSHTFFLSVSLLVIVFAASMREIVKRQKTLIIRPLISSSFSRQNMSIRLNINSYMVGLSIGLMVTLRSNNAVVALALSLPLLIIWRIGLVRVVGTALTLYVPFQMLQHLETGNIFYPLQKANINPYFFEMFVKKRGSANSLISLLDGAFRWLNHGLLLGLGLAIFSSIATLWSSASRRLLTSYIGLLIGTICAAFLSLRVSGEVYLTRYWLPPLLGFFVFSVLIVLLNCPSNLNRTRTFLTVSLCCFSLVIPAIVRDNVPDRAHTSIVAVDSSITIDPRWDKSLLRMYSDAGRQLDIDGAVNTLAMVDFPEFLLGEKRRVSHVDAALVVLPIRIDKGSSTKELVGLLTDMQIDSFVSVNSEASFQFSTDRYRPRSSNPEDLWAQWLPWSSDLLRSIHDYCASVDFTYNEMVLSVASLKRCGE